MGGTFAHFLNSKKRTKPKSENGGKNG